MGTIRDINLSFGKVESRNRRTLNKRCVLDPTLISLKRYYITPVSLLTESRLGKLPEHSKGRGQNNHLHVYIVRTGLLL